MLPNSAVPYYCDNITHIIYRNISMPRDSHFIYYCDLLDFIYYLTISNTELLDTDPLVRVHRFHQTCLRDFRDKNSRKSRRDVSSIPKVYWHHVIMLKRRNNVLSDEKGVTLSRRTYRIDQALNMKNSCITKTYFQMFQRYITDPS